MGCNELQIPIIEIAKQTGLKIISVDRDCTKSLREKSDIVINQDLKKCRKIITNLKAIQYKNIIGYYGVADYAYESIYKIFKTLKLKNKQLFLIKFLTDKIKTNRVLKNKNINHPKSFKISNKRIDLNKYISKEFSFPYILKPSSSYNSLGINEVCNSEDLDRYTKKLKNNFSLFIQEKIEGKVFNIDLIYLKNKVIRHAYTERYFFKNFQASYSIEHKNNEKFTKYFEKAEKICEKIGINFGPITMDFIEKDEKLYLLEISQHLHSIYLNKISGRLNNIKFWFQCLKDKKQKNDFISKTEYHGAYINVYSNCLKSLKKTINKVKLLKSFTEFKKRRSIHFKTRKDYLYGILFLKNKSIIKLKKDISKINCYLYNFNDTEVR